MAPKGKLGEGRLRALPPKPERVFLWDMEKLELVPEDSEVGEHGVPSSSAAASTFNADFPPEEINEAVGVCMNSKDLAALYEASSLLREATAAGAPEECRSIIAAGGLRALLALLSWEEDAALQEDAVMSMLNLERHESLRSLIDQAGMTVPLLKALKSSTSPSVKSNIAAMLKLCIRNEVGSFSLITGGAIDTLVAMLKVKTRSAASTPRSSMPRAWSRSVSRAPSSSAKVIFCPTVNSAGDDSVHNACLALMHLAHFKPVRNALIKAKVVPLLVEVSRVRDVVDAEHALCALFQLLARSKGGPEAICIDDEGAGADTLVDLAINGEEICQDMAVDALSAAATAENKDCARALAKHGVPQKLAGSTAFNDCSMGVRKKVMVICTACVSINANSPT